MPGAPILHLSLLVDAPTGSVTGHAMLAQAVAPPYGEIKITNITGHLQSTGFGKYTKVVALKGEALISFPPPAIGSYLELFSGHFAINDRQPYIHGSQRRAGRSSDSP
ncbi:MAG: DUF1842 domain-containing protein [Deltaproteobacteria bacterium]|nr:DUF1842 domain-containing protein [Deltaproteobacteria bacterium]